jgi:hypothetical protein
MTEQERMPSVPGKRKLSRRRFLVLLSAGAAAVAGSILYRFRLDLYSRLLAVQLDPREGTGKLRDDELATLVALGDVLFPSEWAQGAPRAEAGRAVTAGFFQGRAATVAGAWTEYRRAVELLDRWAGARGGKPFAAMPLGGRRALVNAMLRRPAQAGRADRLLLFLEEDGRSRWRLWHHVAQPLLAEFYTGPAGWEVVGYPVPPGQCVDIDYYQNPPAAGPGATG